MLKRNGLMTNLVYAEVNVTCTKPIVLFFSLDLLNFIKSDWQIKRYEGIIAIVAYITFMVLVFSLGRS